MRLLQYAMSRGKGVPGERGVKGAKGAR